jgi:hypothetical protein
LYQCVRTRPLGGARRYNADSILKYAAVGWRILKAKTRFFVEEAWRLPQEAKYVQRSFRCARERSGWLVGRLEFGGSFGRLRKR